MSDINIKSWEQAKSARQAAESWNNLPNGRAYQNDTFSISLAHCKAPALVRAGQQSCGGQNYWETEKDFNLTILEWLVENWKTISPEIIQMMKDKEASKLKACQEYVTKMQDLINQG